MKMTAMNNNNSAIHFMPKTTISSLDKITTRDAS